MAILGFPHFHRPKVKPKIWGPPDQVAFAVRDWCENKLGTPVPILAMPMWEGGGNFSHDLSGNYFQGVFNNGISWKNFRLLSSGAINSYISCGDSCPHNGKGTIIVSLTPYNLIGDDQGVVSNRRTGESRWVQLTVRENRWAIIVNGSGGDEYTTLVDSPENQKAVIAATWESNVAIKLYKNGILKSQDLAISDATPTNTSNILIGSYYDLSSTRSLNADFDYTYIFDVVLTANQVALFNTQPYAMFEPVSRPSYFFTTIIEADTDLLDGKLVVKDFNINQLDGKTVIKDTLINFFDGKVTIAENITDLLDGKIILRQYTTDILDGKIIFSIGIFPTGHVAIQFDVKTSEIIFEEKAPEISFTAKKAEIVFQ